MSTEDIALRALGALAVGAIGYNIGYTVCWIRTVRNVFDPWIKRADHDTRSAGDLKRVWEDFKRGT